MVQEKQLVADTYAHLRAGSASWRGHVGAWVESSDSATQQRLSGLATLDPTDDGLRAARSPLLRSFGVAAWQTWQVPSQEPQRSDFRRNPNPGGALGRSASETRP